MRASEFFGKPIVSADGGENVGKVEDLLLNEPHREAVGMLVSGGLLSRQQVLPLRHVQTVGTNAVIVRTASEIADAREWLQKGFGAHRSRSLFGKEVVTAAGTKVGSISDLLLEDGTGRVLQLEVVSRSGRHTRHFLVHVNDDMQLDRDIVVAAAGAVSDENPAGIAADET